MAAPSKPVITSHARRLPRELVLTAGFGAGIFGVVVSGSAICEAVAATSPWITAAAYGLPGAAAFGLYWLLARRIRW